MITAFSIFVSLLFFAIGTASIIACFYGWSWQSVALAILFYTKAFRGMVLGFRLRKRTPGQRMIIEKDFRVIAAGFLLTAMLLFVSWFAGEGLFGLFGAIAFFNVAWMLWFAAKSFKAV